MSCDDDRSSGPGVGVQVDGDPKALRRSSLMSCFVSLQHGGGRG